MATLLEWQQRQWSPLVFGGLLRDVLITGVRSNPRDIDIVVRSGSTHELELILRQYIQRRNRFGGLHLQLNNWNMDVWPLDQTWAFASGTGMAATPENLPKTTFLNVEAIAISLTSNGDLGRIFEHGFFEALQTRVVDINYECNPYPALSAVRALATALKLRYAISPRLSRYIIETHDSCGSEAMAKAQESHYGWVRFRQHDIESMVAHLNDRLHSSPDAAIKLPQLEQHQLSLWKE